MNEMKNARVAIVSEQPIFRRGLQSLLLTLPDLSLVGEARNGVEAIQLCQISQPDLILLDFKEASGNGQDVIHHIFHHWPDMQVVLMLGPSEEVTDSNSLDSAPIYYLSKDISEEEFKAALDHIRLDAARVKGSPAAPYPTVRTAPVEESERISMPRVPALPRSEEIMSRELEMAGRIQADILPHIIPNISGWEISPRLEPARETSGDFYDFIPLTDRKWGVVIADVTDKGMGAALFMAMASSLFRTYAGRYPTLPAMTLASVNERILSDTRGSMFVTATFGILEPATGRFIYASAGHPPAYFVSGKRGKESVEQLRRTGMVLGVSEQATWRQKIIKFQPGDTLVLYTDGITEAQSPKGEFFGEDRIVDITLANRGKTASQIQEALLKDVHRFVGNNPRQDDIAVIVIRRKEAL